MKTNCSECCSPRVKAHRYRNTPFMQPAATGSVIEECGMIKYNMKKQIKGRASWPGEPRPVLIVFCFLCVCQNFCRHHSFYFL